MRTALSPLLGRAPMRQARRVYVYPPLSGGSHLGLAVNEGVHTQRRFQSPTKITAALFTQSRACSSSFSSSVHGGESGACNSSTAHQCGGSANGRNSIGSSGGGGADGLLLDGEGLLEGRRVYHFFVNERGDLYHLYDISATLPALEAHCAAGAGDGDGGRRGGLPSGPAHIRDWAFVNFFMRNLFVNAIGSEGAEVASPATTAVDPSGASSSTSAPTLAAPATANVLLSQRLFPFVSYCGRAEVNFVACERLPIVFKALLMAGDPLPDGVVDHPNSSRGSSADGESAPVGGADGNHSAATTERPQASRPLLVFAGSLAEPFDPAALRVDAEGYLYHAVTSLTGPTRGLRPQRADRVRPTIGLVGADVGLRLGFEFIDEAADIVAPTSGAPPRGEEGGGTEEGSCGEGAYVITWGGATLRIPPLEPNRV